MRLNVKNEPDFLKACEWWTDLSNIWTPIGWKNHLFRFNVFWNGTIMAEPAPTHHRTFILPHAFDLPPHERLKNYEDLGIQLSFAPFQPGYIRYYFPIHDNGMVKQGWVEKSPTPILWTEWSHD